MLAAERIMAPAPVLLRDPMLESVGLSTTGADTVSVPLVMLKLVVLSSTTFNMTQPLDGSEVEMVEVPVEVGSLRIRHEN